MEANEVASEFRMKMRMGPVAGRFLPHRIYRIYIRFKELLAWRLLNNLCLENTE